MGWNKRCYTLRTVGGVAALDPATRAAYNQELRRQEDRQRDEALGPLRAEVGAFGLTSEPKLTKPKRAAKKRS